MVPEATGLRDKIRSISKQIRGQYERYKEVEDRLDKCIDNPDHAPAECQGLFNELNSVTKDIHDLTDNLLNTIEEYHRLIKIPK